MAIHVLLQPLAQGSEFTPCELLVRVTEVLDHVAANLADCFGLFATVPGLRYAARYEQARSLWQAGQQAEARERFAKLYADTLNVPDANMQTGSSTALGSGSIAVDSSDNTYIIGTFAANGGTDFSPIVVAFNGFNDSTFARVSAPLQADLISSYYGQVAHHLSRIRCNNLIKSGEPPSSTFP